MVLLPTQTLQRKLTRCGLVLQLLGQGRNKLVVSIPFESM